MRNERFGVCISVCICPCFSLYFLILQCVCVCSFAYAWSASSQQILEKSASKFIQIHKEDFKYVLKSTHWRKYIPLYTLLSFTQKTVLSSSSLSNTVFQHLLSESQSQLMVCFLSHLKGCEETSTVSTHLLTSVVIYPTLPQLLEANKLHSLLRPILLLVQMSPPLSPTKNISSLKPHSLSFDAFLIKIKFLHFSFTFSLSNYSQVLFHFIWF